MEETTTQQLFIKMAIDAWQTENTRVDKLLTELSDEQLAEDIAPNKNSGVYLLGHLTAVNDNLFKLLGVGTNLHPELTQPFLANPDKSGLPIPGVADLRKYWKEVNTSLTTQFNQMSAADWLDRHTAVSPEDFAKEPHRNKLNVILNRTNHQSYHRGQLILLKKKNSDE